MTTLTAELERALLREILATWRRLNVERFDGAMRAPQLVLVDTARQLGQWRPADRRLALSRPLVLEHRWGHVVEVLKHEMAHQYVHEVVGLRHEPAHGPAFRRVCAERDIDPRASGLPSDPGEPQPAVVRKIRALLALAESDNVHEAEAATRAAHRLMRRHNIDRVEAGVPTAYAFREVGPAKCRFDPWEKRLADVLANHYFVEAIWVSVWLAGKGRRGRALELCGARHDVELAAWVHDFLRDAGERCWREHRRRNGIRGNGDRRTFLLGLMAGFDAQLRDESRVCEREGLIWRGDPGLGTWVRGRHRSLRRVRIRQAPRTPAWREGVAAGHRLRLRRPVRSEGSARQLAIGTDG